MRDPFADPDRPEDDPQNMLGRRSCGAQGAMAAWEDHEDELTWEEHHSSRWLTDLGDVA